MRPSHLALPALAVLAACATPPRPATGLADPAIRAHLAAVRAQQGPQEPAGQGRKIDQIQPARMGLRRYHIPGSPLRASVEAGVGDLEVRVPGTTQQDETAFRELRLGLDGAAGAALGPGIRLRAWSTDDDLFAGTTLNDGAAPQRADTRVLGFQAFPHLHFQASPFEVVTPCRLGVVVDYVEFDHRFAEVDRSWLTVGARFEAAPRLPLLGTTANGLDLFARVGGELAYGWFRERFAPVVEGDHTHRWSYDVGLGLRWHVGDWVLTAGYELGQTEFGDTTTGLWGDRDGVEMDHRRVFVGGSVVF